MWPPGTSWRRENELLPKKRSFVLWESELKAPTLRMKWKLMVSFSFPSISLPPFVTELSKMWKGVVARDVSSVVIFFETNSKVVAFAPPCNLFFGRTVEGWQGQRCKACGNPSCLFKKVQEKFWFLGLWEEDQTCYKEGNQTAVVSIAQSLKL